MSSVRHSLHLLLLLGCFTCLPAQTPPSQLTIDSDHDGLPDALEQSLLVQFAPSFLIGQDDCSDIPAQFLPELTPSVKAEDGTIYGQVSPHAVPAGEAPMAEIHFYHLWKRDCGHHGHPLDTEHVAVLVRASTTDLRTATWHALYWYAAAHENTVCDVSQIARASTLKAEDHGAKVWISPGKHASYLNETLCRAGCGADRCEQMTSLHTSALINLGEPGHPMHGSLFIASNRWPLADKMSATNFPAAPISRLNALPVTDIAWFSPGRHPTQGIISRSSATQHTLAEGSSNTTSALATSGHNTSTAISLAQDSTGNALDASYRHTTHALGNSLRHVRHALHLKPTPKDPSPSPSQ